MSEKRIECGMLLRTAELNRADLDIEKRTVKLAFSSELPVERWFGTEILDHTPDSVDLSRLRSGGALLMEHDPRMQIGVVESATVDPDKVGRATVRFGKSARAEEIFQDVKDGIRRLVSVGYRIKKMVTEKVEEGVETLRAMSWAPLEISFVAVPADASVGVGRGETTDKQFVEIKTMSEQITTPAPAPAPAAATVDLQVIREQATQSEIARQKEIQAIADRLAGKVPNIRELANKAVENRTSIDEFRKVAMDSLPTLQPVRMAEPLDIKPKDWQRYSIRRVIELQATHRQLDGFEGEINQEVSLKTGQKAEGAWVPPEAFASQGYARNFVAGTPTLGGFIVSTPNLGDQFIELLRNRAKVMMLGARTLNLENPVTIPRQNAAGSTNWVGETTAATLSTGNFTQLTLTPFGISAFQQYGKQLLATNNPSIDALIRDDIVQQIALAIDLAALHGSGSPQPTGIAGTTGVNLVTLSANGLAIGNATAYPAMVSLETVIANSNADVSNMAYLMRAGHRGVMKGQARFSSTDTPVWGDNNLVNGYRAEVTQQIATNMTMGTATTICSTIFFGDWSQLIIANFAGGNTDLIVDPYVLAANAVVRVIARKWVDIGVRHPAGFAMLLGVLTT